MKRWTYFARITAAVAALFASNAILDAGTILYYDSVNGGTANALDRLDTETDANFVTSASAKTTLGSNAVFSTATTATTVQGLGDGGDKSFRFGSSSGGAGTMAGSLGVAHMANGPYIEVSFTAAQDLILDELSFKLYNNSNNGSSYGARDAGLFVKVAGDNFVQFGESFTSPTNNGIQGTVTFNGYTEAAEGDLVVLRIAFTDRTRTNNDNQAATRIGAINISASAGPISEKLRVITYNIHGGKGPDGEGTPESNLTAFRNTFMQNEDVLCLQEVDNGDCWTAVQSVFSDYPYRYRTINTTTRYTGGFSFLNKQTSVAILSKYPFVSTHNKLVNTDPSIDKWERHGQHVQIEIGNEIVHIFNYHNTFDPEDGGTSSEQAGMVKFRDYIIERLGANALTEQGRVLALGDFNINGNLLDGIMPDLVQRQTDWVDHVAGMSYFSASGAYATAQADLSDHDAVWASLDLASPTPRPLSWESAPAETGATTITMTASTANDTNGVQYYFTNTTIANGSHDSGWQDSPVFTDTGLNAETFYSYTVKARDKSVNQNESSPSALTTAVGYTSWESGISWEPGDDNSPSGDPDTDGINNGMEFVLGGNPIVADASILPTATLGTSSLTFSYSRTEDSKASTTQKVQWSTDLSEWNDIVIPPSDPDSVSIDIPRSNAPDGILFTRLHVLLP